jgi:hypothetical protein
MSEDDSQYVLEGQLDVLKADAIVARLEGEGIRYRVGPEGNAIEMGVHECSIPLFIHADDLAAWGRVRTEYARLEEKAKSGASYRWNFRPVLGSFLSALVGWVACLLLFGCLMVCASPGPFSWRVYSHPTGGNEIELQTYWQVAPGYLLLEAIFSAILIFGTWFLILVPLYLYVPARSLLWRWPVCTICGAMAGAAIMILFGLATSSRDVGWDSFWPSCEIAAGIGAVTCLFASLTRARFRE